MIGVVNGNFLCFSIEVVQQNLERYTFSSLSEVIRASVNNQLLQLCTARTAWSDSVIRSETSLKVGSCPNDDNLVQTFFYHFLCSI